MKALKILAIATSLANSVHGIQKTDPIAEKLRDRPESEVDPAVKMLRKGNDLINPESEVLRGVRPLSGASAVLFVGMPTPVRRCRSSPRS
jgi:hypothetical protein